jgi:PEP-CTERM motif
MFMNRLRVSLTTLALGGALSIALSATPAAAVTFTDICTDCLAVPPVPAAADLGVGTLVLEDFSPRFHKIVDPQPDCITGCGGAVPEPTTWVLMFLGFGLMGAHLRAGRRLGVV